uniref:Uncharacterized protein LOC104245088 n=1 Tax=Nicotiana sylvestris TaxID=4096 RepID=A0A1U7YJG2_NICSY|nr:PREDICTED: uncharacterized protein LOC104245088 [Nicotiana sylvestris]
MNLRGPLGLGRLGQCISSPQFWSLLELGLKSFLRLEREREAEAEGEENIGRRMIHRKWSLLTGPAAILGGIVGAIVVANFIFVQNDPFLKPDRKQEKAPSNK